MSQALVFDTRSPSLMGSSSGRHSGPGPRDERTHLPLTVRGSAAIRSSAHADERALASSGGVEEGNRLTCARREGCNQPRTTANTVRCDRLVGFQPVGTRDLLHLQPQG